MITWQNAPRPPVDTGLGLHDSNEAGSNPYNANGKLNPHDPQTDDRLLLSQHARDLRRAGITWYKILADGENKTLRCQVYIQHGIMPIVRLWSHRPHDRYVPDPYHIQQYVAVGVKYFEIGNEYNLRDEWRDGGYPSDPLQVGRLVARQWVRAAPVVTSNGGIPVLYAPTPGGHVNHRTATQSLVSELRSLGRLDLLQNAVIGIHPRPLNNPPDAPRDTGSPPNTTTWNEHTWFIEYFTSQLGYTPAFVCTEHGYSPTDSQNSDHPPITDGLWAQYNTELFARMNPSHPRKIHGAILCLCYWLEINQGAGGVWVHDAPFGSTGNRWIGDGPKPDDRSWGRALWTIQPNWDRRTMTGETPVPPPTDPVPPPNPTPIPPRELVIIDTEGEPYPSWLTISEAKTLNPNLRGGDRFWYLRRVEVRTHRVQDKTNVFIVGPRSQTLRGVIKNTTTGQTDFILLNKNDPVVAGDAPIWGQGQLYSVEIEGGKSDRINGIRLPVNHHWSYYLTFEEQTIMTETPVPPTNPTTVPTDAAFSRVLFDMMTVNQIPITPTFALPRRLIIESTRLGDNRQGYDIVTPEVEFDYQGTRFVFMGAQNPSTLDKIVAVAIKGQWGDNQIVAFKRVNATGVVTVLPLNPTPDPSPPVTPDPTPVPPTPTQSVRLTVPYRSQLDPVNAQYGLGDCGPACLSMVLAYRGVELSVDRIGLAMGLPVKYLTSDILALERAADKFETLYPDKEISMTHRSRVGVPDLIDQLNRGNPVILLIDYDELPYRRDPNYHSGHYIVGVGYRYRNDVFELIYHDPYWVTETSGAFAWIDQPSLLKAWSSTDNFVVPRQMLVFDQ